MVSSVERPSVDLVLSFILQIQLEIQGHGSVFTIPDAFFLWTQTYKVTNLSGDGENQFVSSIVETRKKAKLTAGTKKVKIGHLKGLFQDNSFCLRIPVDLFGTMELPFRDHGSKELQRGTKQASVLLSGEEP